MTTPPQFPIPLSIRTILPWLLLLLTLIQLPAADPVRTDIGGGPGDAHTLTTQQAGAEMLPLLQQNNPEVRAAQRFLLAHRILHGTVPTEEAAHRNRTFRSASQHPADAPVPPLRLWMIASGLGGLAPPCAT